MLTAPTCCIASAETTTSSDSAAANTATSGFTEHKYTDAACSAGAVQEHSHATDACTGTPHPVQYTCATTSATVGLVQYGTYSAAGCGADQLNGAGYFLINYCEREDDSGAWSTLTLTLTLTFTPALTLSLT